LNPGSAALHSAWTGGPPS